MIEYVACDLLRYNLLGDESGQECLVHESRLRVVLLRDGPGQVFREDHAGYPTIGRRHGQAANLQVRHGQEGLTAFNENGPFDICLIDWNMPNMNGLELVIKIREKDTSTPLIMVTTEAEKPNIIQAIKAGVNNYVVKPFTPDGLKSKIEETIRNSAQTA